MPVTRNCLTQFQIVASVVDLDGELSFVNNSVEGESAAIHLLSFGQIRLNKGLNMTFDSNTGR